MKIILLILLIISATPVFAITEAQKKNTYKAHIIAVVLMAVFLLFEYNLIKL